VPEPGNPQSLNRQSYVLNSPLNYVDPSGYVYDDWADCSVTNSAGTYDTSNGAMSQADCWQYNQEKNILEAAGVTGAALSEITQDTQALLAALTQAFGISFYGSVAQYRPVTFSWGEAGILTQAMVKIARVFGMTTGNMEGGAAVFKAVYGGTSLTRMPGNRALTGGSALALPGSIYLWGKGVTVNGVIHEFGHAFDFKYVGGFHVDDRMLVTNGMPAKLLNTTDGYSRVFGYGPFYTGEALGVERFADMFMGYVLGGFNLAVDEGRVRSQFMDTFMTNALAPYAPGGP
jgi:hypothetical protein